MLHSLTSAPSSDSEHVSDPLEAYPGIENAFSVEERALGIQFYQAKTSFFLPYTLLKGMEYTATRITLEFPDESVAITGKNLHPLYLGFARQKVWRVVEQGDGLVAPGAQIVAIRRILRS